MFCSVRDYHIGDIDFLTKFLGHYNDLEYGRVYSKLSRMLPPPPTSSSSSWQLSMEGVDMGGGGGGRRRGGKQWRKNAENVNAVVSCKEDGHTESNTTDVAL